jgi:transposase
MQEYTTVIGIDLGDKESVFAVMDSDSDAIQFEGKVATTRKAFERCFSKYEACTIALEVGTHSPWVSRLLEGLGHEVLVANARRLRMIYGNDRKNDKVDSQMLARVARLDRTLLYPITHRGETAQKDMVFLRARDGLVRARSRLVSQVRGIAKSFGERLPACDAHAFHRKIKDVLPSCLQDVLDPLLKVLKELSVQIDVYDKQIAELCVKSYPETTLLRQIKGVGPVTALGFVLAIENPDRFRRSRDVGCYLGLVPRQAQSGSLDPQLRITKAGNAFVRRLLVGAAQYILGPFGEDCALREWGLRLATGGSKRAKKRAVVAVARKLGVLLHRLWVTGEEYDPHRGLLCEGATS